MNHPKPGLYFLLVVLSGVFILTFFIFKPFLFALILAIIFATTFAPVHQKAVALTKKEGALAALLATLAVFIVVIIPIGFLSIHIFQESTQLYPTLVENGGASELSRVINNGIERLSQFSPSPITLSIDINQYLSQGVSWLLQHLIPLFASAAKVVVGIFIFLIALYYFFKDGRRLKRSVVALSPLEDSYDEKIFAKLEVAITSVVRGNLSVAFIQGILTAIGFAIFGVPNPALWGSVTAIAALVPSVGTSLILAPAILFLYFSGDASSAAGLLVWGIVAVGLVDNFLGPYFVERGVRTHPLLILLSILGGISFFGPIGFLLGPLVISFLFVLLEVYGSLNKDPHC